MKKTILAIALVLVTLTTAFAQDGNLYVGIDPKFQLPSFDLTKGEKISSFGFGSGLEVGYQTEDLYSAGFRTAFEYYLPGDDTDAAFFIPVGLRLAKEVPVTATFSLLPFLGLGGLINVTDPEFRPYMEAGLQFQFYYDEKWNFFVGYDANLNFNKNIGLQHGISLGFRFYPLREKTTVDVGITQDGNRIKIDVPAIIFDANAATYDSQSIAVIRQNKKVLDTVAKLLKDAKYASYNVTVEAYANAVLGTEEEKPVLKALSQARADAVMGELVKRGIEAARLSAVGKGARDTGDAAQNRRAEFILEK